MADESGKKTPSNYHEFTAPTLTSSLPDVTRTGEIYASVNGNTLEGLLHLTQPPEPLRNFISNYGAVVSGADDFWGRNNIAASGRPLIDPVFLQERRY